jgi:hypothetical protein
VSPVEIGAGAIAVLVVLIVVGMPIGVSMLGVSFLGVALIRGDIVALRMIGQVANDSLREYLFAVVPLFVLMGLLVTVSGVGKDTFDVFQRLLRRITAGLGIATVFANAVFASITGISIASATVFSRVAVPEMVRHGYTRKFATGVVAGSSVLGMLIPPSLLLIVYLQLAVTVRADRLPRTEIFIFALQSSHPRAAALLNAAFDLAGGVMVGLIAWSTVRILEKDLASFEFIGVPGIATVPTWPFRALILVGVTVAAVEFLVRTVTALRSAGAGGRA